MDLRASLCILDTPSLDEIATFRASTAFFSWEPSSW